MSDFRTYQCACDRPITSEADMRAHVAAGHGEPPSVAPAIYERRPDETCSCSRLNAREGTSLTYYCSRCPSAASGDVYERGGYVAHGVAVVPTGRLQELMPLIREAVAAADARGPWVRPEDYRPTPETLAMWKSAPRLDWCAEHGSECARDQSTCRLEAKPKCSRCGGHCTSDATCRPTPAAMLGEAADLLKRAQALIAAVPVFDGQGLAGAKVQMARDLVMLAKENGQASSLRRPSTVQAEPKPASNSCWQCDAPLGTTEGCIMCAAKRREDSANGVGP